MIAKVYRSLKWLPWLRLIVSTWQIPHIGRFFFIFLKWTIRWRFWFKVFYSACPFSTSKLTSLDSLFLHYEDSFSFAWQFLTQEDLSQSLVTHNRLFPNLPPLAFTNGVRGHRCRTAGAAPCHPPLVTARWVRVTRVSMTNSFWQFIAGRNLHRTQQAASVTQSRGNTNTAKGGFKTVPIPIPEKIKNKLIRLHLVWFLCVTRERWGLWPETKGLGWTEGPVLYQQSLRVISASSTH